MGIHGEGVRHQMKSRPAPSCIQTAADATHPRLAQDGASHRQALQLATAERGAAVAQARGEAVGEGLRVGAGR